MINTNGAQPQKEPIKPLEDLEQISYVENLYPATDTHPEVTTFRESEFELKEKHGLPIADVKLVGNEAELEIFVESFKKAEQKGKEEIKKVKSAFSEVKSLGIDPKEIANGYLMEYMYTVDEVFSEENTVSFVTEIVLHSHEAAQLMGQAKITKTKGEVEFVSPKTLKVELIQVSGKNENEVRDNLEAMIFAAYTRDLSEGQKKQAFAMFKEASKGKVPFTASESLKKDQAVVDIAKRVSINLARRAPKSVGKVVETSSPTSASSRLLDAPTGMGGSIDMTMATSLIINAVAIKKSTAAYFQAEEMLIKAKDLRVLEKSEEASLLEKKGLKLKRQAVGALSTSTTNFIAAGAVTSGGILGLIGTTASLAAHTTELLSVSSTGLGIAGAGLGILAGGISGALNIRNIHKAEKNVEKINNALELFITQYGMYPGTEAEVKVAIEICDMLKKKQDLKILGNQMGLGINAAAIGAGVCTIAVLSGVETFGIGTIVFAAVGLSIASARFGYIKYKKHEHKELQKELIKQERFTETDTGLLEPLYLILKNEQIMQTTQSRMKGKLEDKDELQGMLTPARMRSVFTHHICPLLGMSADEIIHAVEYGMQSFHEHLEKERPELVQVEGASQEILEGLDQMTPREKIRVLSPIWDMRAEMHALGKTGKYYFPEGLEQFKPIHKNEKNLKKLELEASKLERKIHERVKLADSKIDLLEETYQKKIDQWPAYEPFVNKELEKARLKTLRTSRENIEFYRLRAEVKKELIEELREKINQSYREKEELIGRSSEDILQRQIKTGEKDLYKSGVMPHPLKPLF